MDSALISADSSSITSIKRQTYRSQFARDLLWQPVIPKHQAYNTWLPAGHREA